MIRQTCNLKLWQSRFLNPIYWINLINSLRHVTIHTACSSQFGRQITFSNLCASRFLWTFPRVNQLLFLFNLSQVWTTWWSPCCSYYAALCLVVGSLESHFSQADMADGLYLVSKHILYRKCRLREEKNRPGSLHAAFSGSMMLAKPSSTPLLLLF